MKNHISRRFSVFCLLFSVFCEAALIKSPVPPSAEGHFVRDSDGDGVADQIAIRFLNPVDSAYLKNSVDSITISDNFILASLTPKKDMLFLEVVGRGNVTSGVFATLYQKGAAPVKLSLADSLAPIPVSANVFAGSGMNADTLVVSFSELVEPGNIGLKLLSKDGSEKDVNYKTVVADSKNLKFVLDRKTSENLSASDVVWASRGVALDLLHNKNIEKKLTLSGVSPFRVVTNPKASFNPLELRAAPIFESSFTALGFEFPENKIGMAVDFGSDEFLKSLDEQLAERKLGSASLENVSIRMDMSVYSHSGEYLTSSHLNVKGSDAKVAGGARVFFFWNFMDGHRRVAGSGVYLVRTTLQVFYQGKLISKDNLGTLHAFGVVRK